MPSEFAAVSADIHRMCKSTVAHVHFAHREKKLPASATANVFMNRWGFQSDGEWEPISRRDVLRVWTRTLHRHLAYKNAEIMPKADAESLATRFHALFDSESSIYLANRDVPGLDEEIACGGTITSATFDLGAIALDATNIGCIWVEDED